MGKLFEEFPPITTQQWEEVILKDLKGADYNKKLVWKTQEGFSVRPYYRGEDLKNIKHLGTMPGEFPYVRGTKPDNDWLVRQTIKVEDSSAANIIALDVLQRGAESLNFNIKNKNFSAQDLDTLLKDIELEVAEVNFSGCAAAAIAPLFIAKIKALALDPKKVAASFNIDPIIKKVSKKGKECSVATLNIEQIKEFIALSGDYKRLRFITVNGHIFNGCGASLVQEVAFSLSVAHEYLVALIESGVDVDSAAHTIKFNSSIGANYFLEIAKFRAARMLWANIVKGYNPQKLCSTKMKVNAITSKFNMTTYDPYVNMLRGTTEAMSGAIAGVSSLEVRPFDDTYASASEFSSRIARNTQLLLKDESHFNQVADAAGGSYYIESLTESIATYAWDLFKEIEAKGGYLKSFEQNFVQDKIEETAAKRDLNIATRREVLLGTNQYPNFTEKLSEESTSGSKAKCCCSEASQVDFKVLKPYRLGESFELLRSKVDKSGLAPKAFMLTLGNLAFCRARAQFSSNFFGCAGIEPIDNTRFESVEEGVVAALESKAQIVVVCSSDDEYSTYVPQVAALLKGKAIVVVAGDPACKAELESQGINNFISVRSNVLETLKSYINELGI